MLKNADFLQKQKSKNSCKNAWYSENIRRFCNYFRISDFVEKVVFFRHQPSRIFPINVYTILGNALRENLWNPVWPTPWPTRRNVHRASERMIVSFSPTLCVFCCLFTSLVPWNYPSFRRRSPAFAAWRGCRFAMWIPRRNDRAYSIRFSHPRRFGAPRLRMCALTV